MACVKNCSWVILFVAIPCAVVIPQPARGASIQWVTIGDAGNDGDVAPMKQDGTTGYGAVAYTYLMAKYDVTNAQYAEFLNAKDPTGANTLGLYDGRMSTDQNTGGLTFNSAAANGSKYGTQAGHANQPITYETWYSALRFANWLNNGQGNADTETGAYTLLGGTQTPSNALTITRNAGAKIFLPSENEWYKAAYYKGGGTKAGYWLYATQHDTRPVSGPPGPNATNGANYNDNVTGYAATGGSYNASTPYLTDVGAYGNSPSAYGTFDQSGDVFNWNEALVTGASRGIRGGSWNLDEGGLPSTNRDQLYHADYANFFIGFRVASIPEPVGAAACLLAGMALLGRVRRVRHQVA